MHLRTVMYDALSVELEFLSADRCHYRGFLALVQSGNVCICLMGDVVVANLWMRDGSASVRVDVIREYLLSSGCRRVYKGVDRCTLLV